MERKKKRRSQRIVTGCLVATAVSGVITVGGCGSSIPEPTATTQSATETSEADVRGECDPAPQELDQAVARHREGNLEEAIRLYSAAILKSPRCAKAFNWRGSAYDDHGELNKALKDLNQAIAISPNYSDAFNNRGEVYRKQGKISRARADYIKALQLEPGFTEARENLSALVGDVPATTTEQHVGAIFVPLPSVGSTGAVPPAAAVPQSEGQRARGGFGSSAASHSVGS